MSQAIIALAGRAAIESPSDLCSRSFRRLDLAHHERRVWRQAADRLSRLPRGPRRGMRSMALAAQPCDLRVVASLPNIRWLRRRWGSPGAGVRFFAPAMRNMLDRECPLSRFAASIDILCCNRREWETLEDREEVAWQVSILVVTDGPARQHRTVHDAERRAGAPARPGVSAQPAPARHQPGRRSVRGRPSSPPCSITAGGPRRASSARDWCTRPPSAPGAAAALELDRVDFGFPTAAEIDEALRAGKVGGE